MNNGAFLIHFHEMEFDKTRAKNVILKTLLISQLRTLKDFFLNIFFSTVIKKFPEKYLISSNRLWKRVGRVSLKLCT